MEVGVVRRHGKARMRTMLVISILLLVPLGVISQMSHSLLLSLEAYHLLYNVLTLGGWLLAAQMGAAADSRTRTFGWARLEVLSTLMTLLLLGALCFSIFVEAIQSLADASHADEMHYPVYVMACAAAILLTNLVCYILIGGYTGLQSTLLAPSETAKRLSPAASEAVLQPDSRLAYRQPAAPLVRHFVRDLGGTLLLVVSAVTAYLLRVPAVRYLDPSLTLLATVLLVASSRNLFSECCLILLQTMPATFDAAAFRTRLLAAFPVVQDVHELHVWQLTPDCVIATAHVVLTGPQQFNDVAERVTAFFAAHAVGRVTLQPEFTGATRSSGRSRCLLPCSVDSCVNARCCNEPVLRRVPTIRVTPPSQVSLASRGSRGSRENGVGKTTYSASQTKNHGCGTAVNEDCIKHVLESDRNGAVNRAGAADADAGGTGDGHDGFHAGKITTIPLSALRNNVSKTVTPVRNATETSVVTGIASEVSIPEIIRGTVPSEGAAEPTVPVEGITEPTSRSEGVKETAPPPELVTKTLLPTKSTTETVLYESVSSIGEWHDAQ